MRTALIATYNYCYERFVGMKPLSERDENKKRPNLPSETVISVGMKPLSERDENPFYKTSLICQ